MAAFIQVLTLAIEKWPILEQIFMQVADAYMKKKHQIDFAKFIDDELKARKSGNTKKLQETLGSKLK